MSYLGIDIGTTGTKILLIDQAGGMRADVHRPATLISPQAGWAEEDPLEWWRNVCEGIPEGLGKANVDARNILAVGVSGMVPTLILVDREGRPLRPSIQQNDARSFNEIEEFKLLVDEEQVFQRTGSMITQLSLGPKLLWLSRNEPAHFKDAAWIMGSYDYINFLLTGTPSVEQNWALESGLYDKGGRKHEEVVHPEERSRTKAIRQEESRPRKRTRILTRTLSERRVGPCKAASLADSLRLDTRPFESRGE